MPSYKLIMECQCFLKLLGFERTSQLSKEKIEIFYNKIKQTIEEDPDTDYMEKDQVLEAVNYAHTMLKCFILQVDLSSTPIHRCVLYKNFISKIKEMRRRRKNIITPTPANSDNSSKVLEIEEEEEENEEEEEEVETPTFKKQVKEIIKHDFVRGEAIFLVSWEGYKGLETREKIVEMIRFPKKLKKYIEKKGGKTRTTFIKKYPELATLYK